MAWPEDSFLPAKGTLNASDLPVEGEIKFYERQQEQIEGVAQMCSERCAVLPSVFNPKPRLFKVAIRTSGGPASGPGVAGGFVFHAHYSFIKIPTAVFHNDTQFSATAYSGYEFVSWSGDVISTSTTITIPDGPALVVNLYANFKYSGTPDPVLASGDIQTAKRSLTIDFIRQFAEQAIPNYINTDVHTNGDISGSSSVTYWTKSALFASLGIGIGGDWTRIPSRNPYGLAAEAGPLTPGFFPVSGYMLPWVEHINELYELLHALKYITRTITFAELAIRQGSPPAPNFTSCDSAKSEALTAWEGNSWNGSSGSLILVQLTTESQVFSPPETPYKFETSIQTLRGKVQCDLSGFAGSGRLFLKVSQPAVSNWTYSNLEAGMVADGNFHEFTSFLFDDEVYQSALLANFEPSFNTNCPLVPPASTAFEGWYLLNSNQRIVIEPNFDRP